MAARLREGYSVTGGADGQHSDSGETEAPAGSEEEADDIGALGEEAVDKEIAASCKTRSSGPHSYSNAAIDKVHYVAPGPNRRRESGKGTTKDEESLKTR